jgi:serine/threonine-protein kinase
MSLARELDSLREVRGQLLRIVSSNGFSQSARMRRFLEFVVEQWLAGRAGEAKEYVIGRDVFDRPADYDPRVDPIVRVEARRLRLKLEAYYRNEGARDACRISLPVGAYAIQVEFRKSPAPPADSVKVSRIRVLSDAARDEFFAEGLTQELVRALLRLPGIEVLSQEASACPRWLVEGGVRRAGNRLRVTMAIVQAADGSYRWAKSYERTEEDPLKFQESVARATAAQLERIRHPVERARPRLAPPRCAMMEAGSPREAAPRALQRPVLPRRSFRRSSVCSFPTISA